MSVRNAFRFALRSRESAERQTRQDKRLSVATNAVAWAIFGNDGREHIIPGMADMSAGEVAIARRIAKHVVAQLDEYDERSG